MYLVTKTTVLFTMKKTPKDFGGNYRSACSKQLSLGVETSDYTMCAEIKNCG
jgi:hypothetical protein